MVQWTRVVIGCALLVPLLLADCTALGAGLGAVAGTGCEGFVKGGMF